MFLFSSLWILIIVYGHLLSELENLFYLFIYLFLSFCLSRVAPTAYGESQDTGPMGTVAAGLHHRSQQRWILNPLSKARDQTHNLMIPSQICFHCATTGTPVVKFLKVVYVTFFISASFSSRLHTHAHTQIILKLCCFNKVSLSQLFLKVFAFTWFYMHGNYCEKQKCLLTAANAVTLEKVDLTSSWLDLAFPF